MIQRTITSLTILFISGITLIGQIPKGTNLIGGELSIPYYSPKFNDLTIEIDPTFGHFIYNNLALGAMLKTEFQVNGDFRSSLVGIGPFIRYYIGQNNMKPIVSISYLAMFVFKTSTSDEILNQLQPVLGLSYGILPSVGIEAMLGYNFLYSNLHGGVDTFLSFRFALQFYLSFKNNI